MFLDDATILAVLSLFKMSPFPIAYMYDMCCNLQISCLTLIMTGICMI